MGKGRKTGKLCAAMDGHPVAGPESRDMAVGAKQIQRFMILLVLTLLLVKMASSPPPLPHSVTGTIFNSDGTTQVPLGTKYIINDTFSFYVVSGETSVDIPGMTGVYFETVKGSDHDVVVLTAWNATSYGRKTYILLGDMENVNVNLTDPRPPEIKVVIMLPLNNSVRKVNETFNVTANITAIGGSDSSGCNATLSFSKPAVLQLATGESFTHELGSIALGNSLRTTWKVKGTRGWSTNITVSSKCSSDAKNFEGLNRYTSYNVSINDSEPPQIQLTSPKNSSWSKSGSLVLVYNVTDLSGIKNCSLRFDGKLNKTDLDVQTAMAQNFTISASEGSHSWMVSCVDNTSRGNNANSSTWIVKVDTIPPNISNLYPYNNLVSPNNTVMFQYNATDVNHVSNCSLVVGTLFVQTEKNVIRGKLMNLTRTFRHGTYTWRISCSDAAGNLKASDQRAMNITDPDLVVTASDIQFSTNKPMEGQNVSINVTVQNIGDENATNVVVRFYEGTYGGKQISSLISNMPAKSTVLVTTSWIGKIGKHAIFVALDPPIETNGSIAEINESNNLANRSIYIKMWQVFYGRLSGELLLDVSSNNSLKSWVNVSNFFGIIYAVDSDSSISWSTLQALSRDMSNSPSLDDFQLLDATLNTTYCNDSINRTYLQNGAVKSSRSFIVYDKNITNVPVVYSTNTTNFVTGILWDYADLSISHFNGSQDVVFVANVGKAAGAYGTYDYEMCIPARLREYRKPNADNTVTFYTEIT
jgi:hypothetical protein